MDAGDDRYYTSVWQRRNRTIQSTQFDSFREQFHPNRSSNHRLSIVRVVLRLSLLLLLQKRIQSSAKGYFFGFSCPSWCSRLDSKHSMGTGMNLIGRSNRSWFENWCAAAIICMRHWPTIECQRCWTRSTQFKDIWCSTTRSYRTNSHTSSWHRARNLVKKN